VGGFGRGVMRGWCGVRDSCTVDTERDNSEQGDSTQEETRPEETEPDARFTFANERTFLAWSRTALALVVAGLGIVQLLPPFPGVPWGRHVLGVPLIAFGAFVAVVAYAEWVRNQRALRRQDPLPRTVMPMLMAIVIAAMAVISAVVLLVSAVR
jgi:putative membrane protein